MKKALLVLLITILGLNACENKPTNAGSNTTKSEKINLRLKWAYQAQFAGYLIAKEKGYYHGEGLDVNINPAGPDLKPYTTVANGTDDVGVGIISQIITARSNGVPLVAIAQLFQDSPNRLVLKSRNKIQKLADLKGKKVGLWLGGDEIEVIAMLKKEGLSLKDLDVVPQKFSIAPFLEDKYVCSQVMVYNELNQIKDQLKGNDLQVISPKDYGAAILGDLMFTNESYLQQHPDRLAKFLKASFKGWDYAKNHREEAIQIVLKYNHELNKNEQLQQLDAVLNLIYGGPGTSIPLGTIAKPEYENAKRIVLGGLDDKSEEYKRIASINIDSTYSLTPWTQSTK